MAGYLCQYYLTRFLYFILFFLVVTAHVNFVPNVCFFLGGGGGGGGRGEGGYRGYLSEIIFTRVYDRTTVCSLNRTRHTQPVPVRSGVDCLQMHVKGAIEGKKSQYKSLIIH